MACLEFKALLGGSQFSEDNDSDFILADTEEDSDGSIDLELSHADYWKCVKCNNLQNNPMYRYCERCYQVSRRNKPEKSFRSAFDLPPSINIPFSLSQSEHVWTCSSLRFLFHRDVIIEFFFRIRFNSVSKVNVFWLKLTWKPPQIFMLKESHLFMDLIRLTTLWVDVQQQTNANLRRTNLSASIGSNSGSNFHSNTTSPSSRSWYLFAFIKQAGKANLRQCGWAGEYRMCGTKRKYQRRATMFLFTPREILFLAPHATLS